MKTRFIADRFIVFGGRDNYVRHYGPRCGTRIMGWSARGGCRVVSLRLFWGVRYWVMETRLTKGWSK